MHPHRQALDAHRMTQTVFSERNVCLSVVCNVRAPYSDDWNFRQCF